MIMTRTVFTMTRGVLMATQAFGNAFGPYFRELNGNLQFSLEADPSVFEPILIATDYFTRGCPFLCNSHMICLPGSAQSD